MITQRIVTAFLALVLIGGPGLAAQFPFSLLNSGASVPAGYNPATDASVVEWLKADALALSNGASVATWTASAGNNAVQAVGGAQPVFNTAVKNGLPAITFGGGKSMTTASFGSLTQPFAVWVVFKVNNSSATSFIFDGLSSSDRAAFIPYNGGSPIYIVHAGNDALTGTMDTGWHIASLVFNGASSTISIDAAAPTTIDTGTNTFVGMTIGARFDLSTTSDVTLGEMVVQNAAPADAAAMFTYFNTRWAAY